MKKKTIVRNALLFIIFALIAIFIQGPIRQDFNLQYLENEVKNINMPQDIEKIAVKSAVGDSGGNGNYSTLRIIMVVKTNLEINGIKDAIDSLDLRFPKYYKSSDNKPIFYVTHCDNSTFYSSRDFEMKFDELESIIDFSNYFYIEFVQ